MNETLSSTDRKNNKKNREQKITNSLKTLIKTNKLEDIWRQLHPKLYQYTWKRKNKDDEASRIDYFLTGKELRTMIKSTDIRPALISSTDHQAISLKINMSNDNKGKGFFKINNSILTDKSYKDKIENVIDYFILKSNYTENLSQLWDLFKN